ncbi:MAG: methylated-DNA--[protein]-cysteine S-methyltransferase [Actinobacteria bacterium]|uniref:methylated-DNA--[protein]-cysteine S-methyltransferase n=1 Tax=freshwater metagenome TaxID=449393 RepID=A0A6J7V110_9ZZZZ|nr:methylated-DNA--[protein]-cysteine S-methyltransferase [Actinomycetota bacterium]MSY35851.1 methylated-DNA--[protein]-cysteine S-methyltransferase [Actinomycetota bacterium]MTA72059.1 methylated-DNA--[protein]-cysteine S-methyltransferase [Actinomycetota bacterium]MTB29036.1 methylated-DNA--[protein]-cysteine S-methyltransferase [Actinomycetota bacterium]MUH48624.1 methylated-DNA--[protein]-cysteine S-methyltransferase [Actinomycetota bacterium]
MPLLVTSLKTPVGTLNLLADDQILIGANLSSISAFKVNSEIKSVKSIPVISQLINDYFDGDLNAINAIKVRQPGASFSQAAWKVMRKVSAGKVISYSDLADKAGSSAAVRAAGSACANNAIMLVVPCHRIVKTGGALGNYAYGVDKKEWLLSHEGFL